MRIDKRNPYVYNIVCKGKGVFELLAQRRFFFFPENTEHEKGKGVFWFIQTAPVPFLFSCESLYEHGYGFLPP